MNKDVVGKVILDSQGKAIKKRVVRIPLACIHIVRSESDLLALQLVVEHQHSSVEYLEFAVPKDMKDLRPGDGGVPDKFCIVDQYPTYLCGETGVPLISSQIKKSQFWTCMKFGTVHLIAADEVQAYTFCYQRHSQAECVRLVNAASKQSNLNFNWRRGCIRGSTNTFVRCTGAR